jgi:hypothetical protein
MYSEQLHQSDKSNVHTLEDFLRASKEAPDAHRLQEEWDKRKLRWLKDLNDLYQKIAGWLEQLKTAGSVSYESDLMLSINEEHLGQYQAPIMTVILGDKRVVFRPIGTNLIGGFGRVDILGPNGKRTLVMKEWGEWQFFSRDVVSSMNVQLNYEPLTEESFKKEMLELIVDQWPS